MSVKYPHLPALAKATIHLPSIFNFMGQKLNRSAPSHPTYPKNLSRSNQNRLQQDNPHPSPFTTCLSHLHSSSLSPASLKASSSQLPTTHFTHGKIKTYQQEPMPTITGTAPATPTQKKGSNGTGHNEGFGLTKNLLGKSKTLEDRGKRQTGDRDRRSPSR